MKPFMKIGSFLLAVMIAITAVGCTPISLNPEWAYKTDKQELAIGVYIYSLRTAYSQAQTFAQDVEGYDESTEAWLDLEITDDDGDKAVAREWIKAEADKMCLTYLALDAKVEELGIDMSGATADSANATAQEYWNMGPYAAYGYYMPMKDELEPFGVSYESFLYCTTMFDTKYSAVFDAVYGEGGEKDVPESEYETFFVENYTDYKFFSVSLNESSTDEAGQATTVALPEEEVKKITEQFDGYAEEINKGASYEDVAVKYQEAEGLENDPTTANIEILEDSSIGEEIKTALGELETNKAKTVKVGDADTAVYYLVYKGDITDDVKDYVYEDANRTQLLAKMKSDEFADFMDELAKTVECEKNQSVIDKYKPELFFVKPEETDETDSESESSES